MNTYSMLETEELTQGEQLLLPATQNRYYLLKFQSHFNFRSKAHRRLFSAQQNYTGESDTKSLYECGKHKMNQKMDESVPLYRQHKSKCGNIINHYIHISNTIITVVQLVIMSISFSWIRLNGTMI